MNADYVLMPGDRLVVHIWGAHEYDDVVMVDQQGNIFLPEIGPIHVAGLRHGALPGHVRSLVASVFTSNVEVYVNLLTAQPVAVYVTGFVRRPGRYAGGMNDSVLYYLDRAGGIIPDRGTYRNIRVRRGTRDIARVDLYEFILAGRLPGGSLRDGDVIVVGPKGGSIFAEGRIPQRAAYEFKEGSFSGAELISAATPQPAVSHVNVTGTRNAEPFHVYMDKDTFRRFPLAADDRVEFLADRPGETIMVSVSGAIPGPTHYPVKREAGLRSLLAHVPVRPGLSNLAGIYIKRKNVQAQQRKVIQDSLHRLEASVLTAVPVNQETAAIQVQEAKLVRDFVDRASRIEPDGVVVVTRNAVTSDIVLEDGDEIVIPQHSDVVQVYGEVQMPKAVVHAPRYSVNDYLREAGGMTPRGDSSNILVVHPNGEIAQAHRADVLPGDLLLVMPREDSKDFSLFKDIVQIIFQIALSSKVVLS
jgi:protein involved in polysaccharide export with SLBB domain